MKQLAATSLAFLLCVCGTRERDVSGQTRIVSLVPSLTETVFALGAGDRLVGTTNQCDYPEGAASKPRVGDFASPDPELVLELEPGLVLLTLPSHAGLEEQFAESGVDTYVSQPAGLEGVFAEIDSVGRLLGVAAKAHAMTDSLRAVVEGLPAFPEAPRVYLEVSGDPLMSAGAGSFLSEAVARAGGRNVFGRTVRDYFMVDPEQVIEAKPDVMVLLHPQTDAEGLVRRVGWSRIPAIRKGHVIDDIEIDLLVRPGPRLVQGIVELHERLAEYQGQ